MITADITGNCGNQQFCYATVRTIAETMGYEWGFNKIPSNDYYRGMQQLIMFDLPYGKEHSYQFGEIPEGIKYIWNEPTERFINPENGDIYDYHKFDENIFSIPDNTKLVIQACQDARYFQHKKDDLKKWFKVKDEYVNIANNKFKENNIEFDENLCILNIRGGPEYRSIPNLILRKKYWTDSIKYMLELNNNMRFIIISDDVQYCNEILDIPAYHFDISSDYYSLTQAKNLIISNSSFAIMPVWLSDNAKNVVAPFGWARHNSTNGYFASSDIWTFGWKFMNRNGEIIEYDNN